MTTLAERSGVFVQPEPSANLDWSQQYRPLRWSLGWLIGSYLGFLAIGQPNGIPHSGLLSMFIAATVLAFAGGYFAKTRLLIRRPGPTLRPPAESELEAQDSQSKGWVVASAIWYALFGLFLLGEYGAGSISDVIHALGSSGSQYAAKFEVYQQQQALGIVSIPVQILTLIAWLQLPLVPFLVTRWKSMPSPVRIVAFGGMTSYAAAFLFQGTLSGLGYLLILTAASALVASANSRLNGGRKKMSKRRVAALCLIVIGFLSYMTAAQTQRLSQFNAEGTVQASSFVSAVLPADVARGFTVVMRYPTGGYLGLANNLGTSFVWTKGRGSSVAFDSYWAQYVGGPGSLMHPLTYPARTQALTGYPADQKWATIYPWLASDLTFPGTIVFMFMIGWLLAKSWGEATIAKNRLALLVFVELAILIAFVPANNQLGLSRTSLIAVVALLATYVAQNISQRLGRFR